MARLRLSADDLLSTTRAVRRRLDLDRPVDESLVTQCLALAIQAPSPSDEQRWHFVVVRDSRTRASLAELYREAAALRDMERRWAALIAGATDEASAARHRRRAESGRHLAANLHRVPVLVVPCVDGRPDDLAASDQAGFWAGIWPATWSFMLAARSRGLGTVLTTLHLAFEARAAEVLGIDHQRVTQAGLLPLAHTIGDEFRPAGRRPLDTVVHRDRW